MLEMHYEMYSSNLNKMSQEYETFVKVYNLYIIVRLPYNSIKYHISSFLKKIQNVHIIFTSLVVFKFLHQKRYSGKGHDAIDCNDFLHLNGQGFYAETIVLPYCYDITQERQAMMMIMSQIIIHR